MILYFDSLIIDRSLAKKNPYAEADNIRGKSMAYKMPKKIDIAKYCLASYGVIPWSHVLIKYELADATDKDIAEFDRFILDIFPKAQIIHERSDSQEDYLKSLEILEQLPDNWIFYAPNNDHPLLISKKEDIAYIDRLLKKAEEWQKSYEFVSVAYSHFPEYLNASKVRSFNHGYFGKGTRFLEQDQDSLSFFSKFGDYNSIQIVNKALFKDWFTFTDLSGKRIMRAEDLGAFRNKPQVVVAPKKELCAHFDGYEHMLGYVNEIWTELLPPLIIPQGFFENNIRIAYGYSEYRPGWTNINPLLKDYSFRNLTRGTDLKIGLDDIPLFWKPRIAEIDSNPEIDEAAIKKALKQRQYILENPWGLRSQGLNWRSVRFRLKYWLYPLRPFAEQWGLVKGLKKIFGY